MEICIDPMRFLVTTAGGVGGTFALNTPHRLDDSHRFVVTHDNRKGALIKLKHDPKVVQRGLVPFLSATAGRNENGVPRIQPCVVDLDPSRPIFPLAPVVDALLAAGTSWGEISPMAAESELTDHAPTDSMPMMHSNGTIECDEIGSTTRFVVSDATWAVTSQDGCTTHVYLWPGAEAHTAEIVATVGRINSGTLASIEA